MASGTFKPFIGLIPNKSARVNFPADINKTTATEALYNQMTQVTSITQECVDEVFRVITSPMADPVFQDFLSTSQMTCTLYLMSKYLLLRMQTVTAGLDPIIQTFKDSIEILNGNAGEYIPQNDDVKEIWYGVLDKVPNANISLGILGLFSISFDANRLDRTMEALVPPDTLYSQHLKSGDMERYESAKATVFNDQIDKLAQVFDLCGKLFIDNAKVPEVSLISKIMSYFSDISQGKPISLINLDGKGKSRTLSRLKNIVQQNSTSAGNETVDSRLKSLENNIGTSSEAINKLRQQSEWNKSAIADLRKKTTAVQDEIGKNTAAITSQSDDLKNLRDKVSELVERFKNISELTSTAIQQSQTTANALASIQTIVPSEGLSEEQLHAIEELRSSAQTAEEANTHITALFNEIQSIRDSAMADAEQARNEARGATEALLARIETLVNKTEEFATHASEAANEARQSREQAAEEIARIGDQSSTLSEAQIAQLLELIGHPDPIPNPGPSGVDGTGEHQDGDSDGNLTPPPIAPRVNIPQKVLAEIYAHAASREQIIAAIHAVEDDIAGSTANAEFLTRFAPGVTQSVIKDILINRTPSGQYITRTGARGGEGIAHTNLTGGHTFISGNRTRPLGSVEVPAGFTQDNSSVLWNEPVITSMGFPFINFGAPEIQMILKGKDEKQVKQSYAKLKKRMKRVGLSSPIKVLKDFKNAKGVTCAINRITVDANDLNEVGNAQVMASVYPRVSTDLQTSIGTVPLTRDFIVEVYNVLSPVKGAKIYMDTLGMSEEEYANMINRNGRPPLYIFVPKERTGFRKGASSFISRLFTSNSKPTLVEAQIGSHHGGFIMPFRTTQLLFTEV